MARLHQVISKLRRIRQSIANPVDFFQSHIDEWGRIARQTTIDVLLLHRPEHADPEEWELQAQYIAGQVTATLSGGDLFDVIGAMIYLGARQQRTFSSTAMAAMTNNLSLEEIADYVAAGMRGDPLGKADIDERDDGKTPEQIAMTISRSLQKGNAEREAAIRAFLEARNSEDVASLYPAIREAWVTVLSARTETDWKNYLSGLIRS